jgi:hypothetical protein
MMSLYDSALFGDIKVTRAGMSSQIPPSLRNYIYNRRPVLLPLISFSAHRLNAEIAYRFSLELNMTPTRVLV